MKTIIIGILFICLTTFSYGQTQGIKIDGDMRQFTMYIPTTINKEKPVALVLNFHGSGMTALEHMFYTEMNATADNHNFIVVYPQGKDNDWNVGFGMDYDDGPKDIEFISQLEEKIKKHYKINPNAVFATGLSRGGFFTHRLAAELPEVFAATTAVGAPIPNEVKKRHTSKEKIAVLLVHGDAYVHVKYNGKDTKYNSVEETIAYWRHHNNSNKEETIKRLNPIEDETSVSITTYSGSKEVVLVKIKNGGHTWRGADDFNVGFPLGKTNHDISFNDVMWKFFVRNKKKLV
jgi:polyhydroxybutyrate depolymerase